MFEFSSEKRGKKRNKNSKLDNTFKLPGQRVQLNQSTSKWLWNKIVVYFSS